MLKDRWMKSKIRPKSYSAFEGLRTGKRFRELRVKRGKTLKQIASKTKFSIGYIADLERSRRNWNDDLVKLISKAIYSK